MRNGAGLRWFLTAVAVLAAPGSVARAEEEEGPGRGVARISVINGDVSVRRGDSGDWVAAAVNAPLVVGDAVATGPGARAEVQFDYANMLRLGSDAEVRLTELEYRRYQVQVARGTAEFCVLRKSDADVDVSTPAVSVRPQKKGAYRISVRDDGETEVTVRSGEVEVYTARGVERLRSGQSMLARSTQEGPEFQMVNAAPRDEFDQWNEQRDRSLERSASYRYVHPSVYGADDLDDYGTWTYDAPYGYVWVPRAGPGWAPYSRGRWVWEDWYGWTWVSYDPWGWAPYHYGRWYQSRLGWCWYPGVARVSYWSPALVAFFGFGAGNVHVGFGFGNVGWVPLAPYEPYYRWYGRGHYGGYRGGYVDRSVNITNVNITNVYRNARVRNGISGMDAGSFGRGGHSNIMQVSHDQIRGAGLVRGQLPVAPDRSSLRLGNGEVRNMPRAAADTRFFSRRQAAPVERIPFAEQQRSFQRVAQVERGNAPARGAEMRQSGGGPAQAGGAGNGWRRAGEPAQGNAGAGQARPSNAGSPARNADGGWRRFGEQRRSDAGVSRPADSGARSAEPARRSQPSDNGGNWRRFGEPSQRQAAPAQRRETPAAQPRDTVQPGNTPKSNGEQIRRDNGNGNRSWQSFGTPERNSFATESAAPRAPRQDSFSRPDRQQSLPIGSPVVRERGTPRVDSVPRMERAPRVESAAPRMERAPRMESSAPRMERSPQVQSAPRSEARSGGGGGGGARSGRSEGGRGGGRNK